MKRRKKLLICVTFAMSMFMVFFLCAFGFGDVTGSSTWFVKAGNKDVVAVDSRATAEQVALGLKISYFNDITSQQKANIYPFISIECKNVKKGTPLKKLDLNGAVSQIKKNNKVKNPPVKVTYKQTIEENKTIAYKKQNIKTDNLQHGQKKVKQKGKTGSQYSMSSIVNINGEKTDKSVIVAQVTTAPVKEVVLEGTRISDKDKGEAVIKYAKKFLGNPYVWGGEDLEKGVDCSGFTMMVYRHFGITLPHSSSEQGNCGKEIKSLEDARAGDLLVYDGHVAFYMGNGKIIHAAGEQYGIIISDVSAGYDNYKTIRRIIGSDLDKSTNDDFVDYMDKVEKN